MALVPVATFTGHHAVAISSGAASIGSAAIGGLETAGAVGGIIGVAAAVITLYVTVTANNRAKDAAYRAEIEAARKDGAEQAQRLADNRIRDIADALTQAREERDFYREQWATRFGQPPEPPGGDHGTH